MSLISLIIGIALIGLVLWLVQISPIDGTVKRIIWWVAIVCIVVFVLYAFGILDYAKKITVPHL